MTALVLPPPIVIVAPARASSPRAFTKQIPEGTWSALPRTFRVVLPFGAFTDDDTFAEAEVAARAWSELPCTSVRLAIARGSASEGAVTGDGVSHVIFHGSEWPSTLVPRALAQTVVVVDGEGKLTDADVHLNGKDHVFSLDGAPGTVDLRSILIHELGHAIGLGHSADPTATMTAAISGTRFRSLEADDEAGACALYAAAAGKGAPRCPETPCPASFVCLAGACERRGVARATCAPCLREVDACDVAGATARCVDVDDGRVCARACDDAHPCGGGFACRATTEAGDRQCVADDGCVSLGTACTSEGRCGDGFTCKRGRCVGPREAELTTDAAPPPTAGPPIARPPTTDDGCAAGGARGSATPSPVAIAVALALALAFATRRRGREEHAP